MASATSLAVASAPAPRPGLPRLIEVSVTGTEQRLSAVGLRRSLPALRDCYAADPAARAIHFVSIELTVSAEGAATNIRATPVEGTTAGGTFLTCVSAALQAQKFEPQKGRAPRQLRATLGFELPPLPVEDELGERQVLRFDREGGCIAEAVFECPPHKDCAPAERRRVACPFERGLPAMAKLDDADRRVDLMLGGGKPGQTAERIALGKQGDACAAKIEQRRGHGPEPRDTSEVFDLPCADFERAHTAALAAFPGGPPRSKAGPDSVGFLVSFWSKRSGAREASVRDVSWAGDSPRNDAFGELADLFARAVIERSERGLVRFRP